MTSGEQSSDINLYIICFSTYTVHISFTVNPNFTNAGILSYKYHIKTQWGFVLTKHVHSYSIVISEYEKIVLFMRWFF